MIKQTFFSGLRYYYSKEQVDSNDVPIGVSLISSMLVLLPLFT